MRTLPKAAACTGLAGILLFASISAAQEPLFPGSTPLQSQIPPMPGQITATFTHDERTGVWTAFIQGSYEGVSEPAHLNDTYIYGAGEDGSVLGKSFVADIGDNPEISSPFELSLEVPVPEPSWTRIGFGIQLHDAAGGITDLKSAPFPVIWEHPVFVNHAIGGSIVDAPNYEPGGIPSGIGIPHTLINSIPEGNYFAVVFFKDLVGCPSSNYAINAFRANAYWGYDVRGSAQAFSRAWNSSGGGCMQEFHVDTNKDGDWLWGALSNTGTAPAIADENGVPAFAICATEAACDPISPSPTDTLPPENKVSSVLFLPGIKGSRLYETNPLCLIPTDSCDIPAWLPLFDSAASALFMNPQGKSLHNVYTKESDLLKDAFGQSFYATFAQQMDDAASNGTFGNDWRWKPVVYDWRMSLSDIVTNGAQHGKDIFYEESTSTPYIEQSLHELASTSPTGKVTIVAHSNGGLVAKALMQKLGSDETSRLIDSVILVGVPQSGAPRTLGALLYGEGENLPGVGRFPNLIMSGAHAREFGLNSPMAYHLLPSAVYLAAKNLSYPLIRFGAGSVLSKERDAYGETIDTQEELRNYMLATERGRTMPAEDDLHSANILNASLLTYAEQAHQAIDEWVPPPGVEVYQLGGYDVDTISGIDTYEVPTRSGGSERSYRPLFTRDGDGTVPIISSLMMNEAAHVHALWVNMGLLTGIPYSHGTMFEMPYIQQAITDILTHTFSPATPTLAAQGFSSGEKRLAFFIHSSATLTLRDENGNRTQAGGVEEETIPGSTHGMFGDVAYVVVPANGTYSLEVRNTSAASFTLDMQDLEGDDIAASSTIAEVPMTENGVARLTVGTSIAHSSALDVDEDGDSDIDFSITPQLGATVFPPDIVPTEKSDPTTSSKIRSHVQTLKKILAAPLSYVVRVASSTATILAQESALKSSADQIVGSEQESMPATSTESLQEYATSVPVPDEPSLWQRILQFLRRILHWVRH